MNEVDRERFRSMTCEEMCSYLAVAICLTQEYVGRETLPPLPGWFWFDALVAYDEWRTPRENRERFYLGEEPPPLLTNDEREVIRLMGRVANLLARIVADGPSRAGDLDELVHHVHVIQRTVGSQAAARAYPDEFRRLGSTLRQDPPPAPIEPDPQLVDSLVGRVQRPDPTRRVKEWEE